MLVDRRGELRDEMLRVSQIALTGHRDKSVKEMRNACLTCCLGRSATVVENPNSKVGATTGADNRTHL